MCRRKLLGKLALIFLDITGQKVLFDTQLGASDLNEMALTARQFAGSCVCKAGVSGGGLGGIPFGKLVR